MLSPNDYGLKLRFAEMLVNELMESNTPDHIQPVTLPALARARRELTQASLDMRNHYIELREEEETED